MGSLFDQNGIIGRILQGFLEIVEAALALYLSVLLIVPAGPMICALCEVMQKKAAGRGDFTVSLVAAAFKKCFKKAAVLWGIVLAAVLFLIAEFRFLFLNEFGWDAFLTTLLRVIALETLLLFALAVLPLFHTLAYFRRGIRETLKLSLGLSFMRFPYFLLLILIAAAPFAVCYLSPYFIIYVLLFAPWCCLRLSSAVFLRMASRFTNHLPDDGDAI